MCEVKMTTRVQCKICYYPLMPGQTTCPNDNGSSLLHREWWEVKKGSGKKWGQLYFENHKLVEVAVYTKYLSTGQTMQVNSAIERLQIEEVIRKVTDVTTAELIDAVIYYQGR